MFSLLSLATLLQAPAAAQVLPSKVLPPLAASGASLKPGTWVSYSLFYRPTNQVLLLRLAALEHEDKAQWIELSMTQQRGNTLVFKALVEGPLSRPKRILKAVAQSPGQRPVLLPEALARKQFPIFTAGSEPGAKLVGTERVQVPAGKFKARHYHRKHGGQETDTWLSEELSGWSLVKVKTPLLLMELNDRGQDARSQVHGRPRRLDEKMLKQLGILPH